MRLMNFYQQCRIAKYRLLSNCANVEGKPTILQPVHLAGKGTIRFKGNVKLGCFPSAYYLSGYTYIEARTEEAVIEIGDGVWMNNNVAIISNGAGIKIGNRSMLGTHVEILDSDFHDLHPDRRGEPGADRCGQRPRRHRQDAIGERVPSSLWPLLCRRRLLAVVRARRRRQG